MGLDASAPRTWRKEKTTYYRPKFEAEIFMPREEFWAIDALEDRADRSLGLTHRLEWWSGSKKTSNYEGDFERHFKNAKKVGELIQRSAPESRSAPALKLLELSEEGWGFFFSAKEGGVCFLCLREFEPHEVEIWERDNYLDDLKFPNSEIPDAFSMAREKFGVDLGDYLIFTECPESIRDEQVLLDTSEAVAKAEKLISEMNPLTVLRERTSVRFHPQTGEAIREPAEPLYLKEALEEAVRVWKAGAKIEIW